jgi:hypothetical protein
MSGERRLAEKVPANATALHRIATVQASETKVQFVEMFTVCGVFTSALSAVAAGLVREHDMIATREVLHLLPNLFYYSSALMPQNHRGASRIPVFAEIYIGMTDSGSNDSHQNLIFPRTFKFEGFDLQRDPSLTQNGRQNYVGLCVRMGWQCSVPFL